TVNAYTAAPAVTVTTPADGAMATAAEIDVAGMVKSPNGLTVFTVNGIPPNKDVNGNFNLTIHLSTGVNTITITASDPEGRITTVTRTVTYGQAPPTVTLDDQPPTLSVAEPNADITTSLSSLVISGFATDNRSAVTVTVSVDGVNYTPALVGTSFTQIIAVTAEKTYAVTVTATDKAGNSTTVKRNITYA